MNEEQAKLTGKNIKIQAELYYTLKAKMCDYRGVDVPIIYNFYSVDDFTCFISYNGRTRLYDIMASSNIKNLFLNYQPLAYGSKFDKVMNADYPEAKKLFKEIIKKQIEGKKICWQDREELRKQVREEP